MPTMISAIPAEVLERYRRISKHSQYQRLPEFVPGQAPPRDPLWRDDRPRLEALRRAVDFAAAGSVLEVGSNAGYFGLSLKHEHPHLRVLMYELDPDLCELSRALCRLAGLEGCEIRQEPFAAGTDAPAVDVLLAMNVLHHLGADYGRALDLVDLRARMAAELAFMRGRCRTLVFQVGLNWGGDKRRPIWPAGSEDAYVRDVLALLAGAGFAPVRILSPVREGDAARYVEVDAAEAARLSLSANERGFLGEFFKRPLFVSP